MTELQTSPALLDALRQAARPLTSNERRQQQVSFVMASLQPGSGITRSKVEAMVDDQTPSKDRN